MITLRRLNEAGLDTFKEWLESAPQNTQPNPDLLISNKFSEPAYDVQVDQGKLFVTRYDFGLYLVDILAEIDFKELMDKKNDGLWAWLAILFFDQLAPIKRKRAEHFIVVRAGLMGSLAYRQGVRTSYELVHIHGENAQVCLGRKIQYFGDMSESLASRQQIVNNKGFFEAAHKLYVNSQGQIRKGSASRVVKLKKRKPGEKRGLGGAERLALSLRRLDLTFDTEVMNAEELVTVLPMEFRRWLRE